jgi:hypothetical protein
MNLKLLSLLGAVGVVLTADSVSADELNEVDVSARNVNSIPLTQSVILEDIDIQDQSNAVGKEHNGACSNGTCS